MMIIAYTRSLQKYKIHTDKIKQPEKYTLQEKELQNKYFVYEAMLYKPVLPGIWE